jgi:cyclic pyranopterin phosphate synthase
MLRTMADVTDRLARPLRDLRVSVTDRCNFRCTYCMPKEVFGPDHPFLERAEILSFEEIERLCRVFASLGTRKLRLTGGEPLVRRGLEGLVERLARLEGIEDLALTTNGAALAERAEGLAKAGLRRVTVSLDSLDDGRFAAINDVGFPVARVLEGIDAAARAGLAPVKVNMVVMRGRNEEDVVPMAARFRGTGHVVRYIEYMDVGTTNGWRMADVVPSGEVRRRVHEAFPLVAVPPEHPGEVATRWRYADGAGEVGFVSSVTAPFCGDCVRARLSADGRLYTCLFATTGTDLKGPLRAGASDDDLRALVRSVWGARTDRYSELRARATPDLPRVEMSFIGG